jgi:hypothetical protein
MLVYGIRAAGLSNWDDAREEFADSLYYLGFIFTLLSLVAMLLSPSLRGSQITADDILGQFGIALVTTAAGLIARTMMTQFVAAGDAMMETDRAAEAAGRQLVESMRQVGTELDILRTEYSRNLEELRRSTSAELTRARDESTAQIGAVSFELGTSIRSVASASVESIERLTLNAVATVGTLQTALEQLTINGNRIEQRIEAAFEPLQAGLGVLATQLRERVGAAEAESVRWGKVGGQLASAADNVTRFVGATASIGDFQERLSGLDQAVVGLARSLEGVATSADRTIAHLQTVGGNLGPLTEQLNRDVREVGELVSRLRQEVEGASAV